MFCTFFARTGERKTSRVVHVDPPFAIGKRFRADSRRRSKRAPTTIIDSTSRETFRHHAYRRYRSVRRLSRQPRPRDQLIEQAREIEFTQLIRGARAHALSLSNTLTTHFCAVLRHRFLPRTPSLPSPPLLPLVLVPVGEIGTTERGNGFLRPHKIRKFIVTVPANLFPLTTIPPPLPSQPSPPVNVSNTRSVSRRPRDSFLRGGAVAAVSTHQREEFVQIVEPTITDHGNDFHDFYGSHASRFTRVCIIARDTHKHTR